MDRVLLRRPHSCSWRRCPSASRPTSGRRLTGERADRPAHRGAPGASSRPQAHRLGRSARLHQGHPGAPAHVPSPARRIAGLARPGHARSRSRCRRASACPRTQSCVVRSPSWWARSTATSAHRSGSRSCTCAARSSDAELAALYAAADVAWVGPLRDGMNLVAKEFVACQRDGEAACSSSASSPAPPRSSARRFASTRTTRSAPQTPCCGRSRWTPDSRAERMAALQRARPAQRRRGMGGPLHRRPARCHRARARGACAATARPRRRSRCSGRLRRPPAIDCSCSTTTARSCASPAGRSEAAPTPLLLELLAQSVGARSATHDRARQRPRPFGHRAAGSATCPGLWLAAEHGALLARRGSRLGAAPRRRRRRLEGARPAGARAVRRQRPRVVRGGEGALRRLALPSGGRRVRGLARERAGGDPGEPAGRHRAHRPARQQGRRGPLRVGQQGRGRGIAS